MNKSTSFYVYIIQNIDPREFYCGQTNDLDRRLEEHNRDSYSGTKTSKRGGSWTLVWSKEMDSRSEAMKLEETIRC